jgi:hypothetical protein
MVFGAEAVEFCPRPPHTIFAEGKWKEVPFTVIEFV